jgi:hypothetical protein
MPNLPGSGPLIVARHSVSQFSRHGVSPHTLLSPVDAAGGVKKQQGLARRRDVVNTEHLNSLPRERQTDADRAKRAFARFVPQHLADKTFARVPGQDRLAQLVIPPAMGGEGEVVLVRFAEADAGVETDSLPLDAGLEERVAAGAEIAVDVFDHVIVRWIVLHCLRRPLHVHGAHSRAKLQGGADHPRIPLQPGDVIHNLGARLKRLPGDRGLCRIDGDGDDPRRSGCGRRMVIPANKVHSPALEPMCIGIAAKCKINANIGNSAVTSNVGEEELEKLHTAVHFGADTVMDLSTGKDIDNIRRARSSPRSPVPIGTVPIYQMLEELGGNIEDMRPQHFLDMVEHQAKQGVDYMTSTAASAGASAPDVNRVTGIVSRGGSLIAKWMMAHASRIRCTMHFDDLCDIMRQYDVTWSLGDGLRPARSPMQRRGPVRRTGSAGRIDQTLVKPTARR